MSNPTLPPYLGSWDELVSALLHNPFLGSGHGGKLHATHSSAEPRDLKLQEPDPIPWREAVVSLIGLVSLKEAASKIANSAAKSALLQNINSAIAADIDDICPPYRRWHWPGPPPGVLGVVSTLIFVSNTLNEGSVRTELGTIASQILQRSFAANTERAEV
jgi:hypothetical protein